MKYIPLPVVAVLLACGVAAAEPVSDLAGDTVDLKFQGVVVPSKQVTIISPLDGILASVEVDEEQRVDARQVLIRIDDALQKLVVDGAVLKAEDQSEIKRAQLALEDAQMKLEQAQDLFNKGAMSKFELQRARLERDLAQAGIEAAQRNQLLAKANLELEREKLARYQLTAPFAGRVLRVQAEQGATVTQDDKLLLLVALDKLEAQLYLPIHMFDDLVVGQTYRLAADEPVNREIMGTLKSIDRVIDTASRTFRCTFTIENADEKLPAGFMARLIWPQ